MKKPKFILVAMSLFTSALISAKETFNRPLTEEEFNKLSPNKKRVAVAKDVIKHLNSKKLFASNLHVAKIKDLPLSWRKGSIKDFMCNEKETECSVCAKGAMFMSYIGRINKLQFEDVRTGNGAHSTHMQYLKEIFDEDQLSLIESCYEGNDFYWHSKNYNKEEYLPFYVKYKDADSRLRAIMNNIIKNNGTFKP